MNGNEKRSAEGTKVTEGAGSGKAWGGWNRDRKAEGKKVPQGEKECQGGNAFQGEEHYQGRKNLQGKKNLQGFDVSSHFQGEGKSPKFVQRDTKDASYKCGRFGDEYVGECHLHGVQE
jgi:hypothetical protein